MSTNLQQARELFLHAVGRLPPEQWGTYVAEACGADAELARQVRHLLQVHLEAGSFLEQPAVGPVGTGAYTPSAAGAPAPQGQMEPGERSFDFCLHNDSRENPVTVLVKITAIIINEKFTSEQVRKMHVTTKRGMHLKN